MSLFNELFIMHNFLHLLSGNGSPMVNPTAPVNQVRMTIYLLPILSGLCIFLFRTVHQQT